MIARRSIAVVASVLALFVGGIVLASCGGDDSAAVDTTQSATSSTQTVTATQTMTAETTTTETAPPPPPGPTEIRIVVVNAAPKGGIVREKVAKGDRVVLVVTSDVTDHIHLHGYDIMRDVVPGKPARLQFRATIPGRFEVELEDRRVPIADITVTP
ncbi:MAG TPA: hypothetical protein VMK83_12760 [Gaiellaceae bacterium]|nr:hypothetical protein [Gaiellaceae bacterium]